MGDLCRRYFIQRPLFMSIDVGGQGKKALSSNDWKNSRCVPDIILLKVTHLKKDQ